jgi:hypothetical protein
MGVVEGTPASAMVSAKGGWALVLPGVEIVTTGFPWSAVGFRTPRRVTASVVIVASLLVRDEECM